MTESRTLIGRVEPILIGARDSAGANLTGLTDLFIRIRRNSDGFFFDWSDDTFKTGASVVTLESDALPEIDSVRVPGLYRLSQVGHTNGFDTALAGVAADDELTIFPLQTPGTDAVLGPATDLKVAEFSGDQLAFQPSYDTPDGQLRIKMWLIRNGVTQLSGLTNATYEIRDRADAIIDSDSSAAFDAHGAASFNSTVALVNDEAFSVRLTMTDAFGTIETTWGLGTEL